MNIRSKDDTVVVLSGKDKGKKARSWALPRSGKVVVEGINMVTCHIKPRKQGEEGGIVKREAAIYACKVQAVCPKCRKATRVATRSRTARRSASASTAALKSEKGGVKMAND